MSLGSSPAAAADASVFLDVPSEEVKLLYLAVSVDCIQGDYSLLQPDVTSQISEQASRRENADSNADSRTLARGMQNLTVDGENGNTADQNVLWPSEANGTSPASQDTTLQRRYLNVPRRIATPSAYPVQEDTESISGTGAH